jgi:CubicO group peptidase (beta-lactamase class C family)
MRFPLLALALPCLMTIATATDAPMTSKAVLPTDLKAKIDAAVNEVLTKTSVPSASIAVIKAGQIVYVSAYGDACLEPKKAAAPEMRYSIGSISKQFTAAAIILLAQDGKLSLDDKVSKYLPNLTRANEISIRQILSHTSGYQDYWPQDYLMPPMKIPTTAEKIMDIWAKKPLDFDPGTKYQYSNTGFVIAGAIVEKISGTALLSFLQNRIFGPLGMKSVWDSDQKILPESDAVGHHRYALGPVRRAQKEGTGWMFAAGNLAMTAEDLAKWDLSVIDQTLLKAGSYHEMETEGRLNNGAGTLYGLGIGVSIENGHRVLGHGGEVMGFTAYNGIYPDDRMAIVVLTNQDAVGAYGTIAKRISSALLESKDEVSESRLALTKKIFIEPVA